MQTERSVSAEALRAASSSRRRPFHLRPSSGRGGAAGIPDRMVRQEGISWSPACWRSLHLEVNPSACPGGRIQTTLNPPDSGAKFGPYFNNAFESHWIRRTLEVQTGRRGDLVRGSRSRRERVPAGAGLRRASSEERLVPSASPPSCRNSAGPDPEELLLLASQADEPGSAQSWSLRSGIPPRPAPA